MEKIQTSKGSFITVKITVKNTAMLSNSYWIEVKAKKGNTIIADGVSYSATLLHGESQVKEIWLSEIDSHNEYDSLNVSVSWSMDGI